MESQSKQKIIACTSNVSLQNELRVLLKVWFDTTFVRGFEQARDFLRAAPHHAVIAELPEPSAIVQKEGEVRQALLDFLETARGEFSNVRRVVVADHCDLSLVIHGLHTGAIDSLLYRPLSINDLVPALRPTRVPAAQGAIAGTGKPVVHTSVNRSIPQRH